ncbi:hypothetical protein CPB85DRAFT_1437399 [Mucidula mucida]|nr:hypothetical protein CPB85DRAFT_1437399 [Mucidula mucida]
MARTSKPRELRSSQPATDSQAPPMAPSTKSRKPRSTPKAKGDSQVVGNSKSRKRRIPRLATRERVFGFLIPNDLIKQHPLYASTIARHPTLSDEKERVRFELHVCSALASAWAFKIQPLWHKASFEMTRYGPIIQLAENKYMHTMVTPSAKVIKRMQKLIEFDVEPKWVIAD